MGTNVVFYEFGAISDIYPRDRMLYGVCAGTALLEVYHPDGRLRGVVDKQQRRPDHLENRRGIKKKCL